MADDSRTAGFLKMLDDLNARYLVGVADVRELWLIRHADAYTGMDALAGGRVDPPLSEWGREQAARLAARLVPVPLHAVWSSDLRRARETAAPLARDHGLAVRVDPRLREVRTHWDEDREPVPVPPGSYPFPEPEAEVAERMRSVVADVVASLDGVLARRPRAALISHNAAIAIYLSTALGLRWGQLRVMPQFTSVSVVAVKGEQVVVQSIADATHLAGAVPSRATGVPAEPGSGAGGIRDAGG